MIKPALVTVIVAISGACFGQSVPDSSRKVFFLTDLMMVESEFNVLYSVGRHIYRSSVKINDNSRINYAHIRIRDSIKISLDQHRVHAEIPLTATVSYVEWNTAFGKRYSRDTVLTGVEMTFHLEAEPQLRHNDLAVDILTKVMVGKEPQFMKNLADIPVFANDGKCAASFRRMVLRHTQYK